MCRVITGGCRSRVSASTASVSADARASGVSVSTDADAYVGRVSSEAGVGGVGITTSCAGADETAPTVGSTGADSAGSAGGAAGVRIVHAAAATITESGGHRAPCRDSKIAVGISAISTQEPAIMKLPRLQNQRAFEH